MFQGHIISCNWWHHASTIIMVVTVVILNQCSGHFRMLLKTVICLECVQSNIRSKYYFSLHVYFDMKNSMAILAWCFFFIISLCSLENAPNLARWFRKALLLEDFHNCRYSYLIYLWETLQCILTDPKGRTWSVFAFSLM